MLLDCNCAPFIQDLFCRSPNLECGAIWKAVTLPPYSSLDYVSRTNRTLNCTDWVLFWMQGSPSKRGLLNMPNPTLKITPKPLLDLACTTRAYGLGRTCLHHVHVAQHASILANWYENYLVWILVHLVALLLAMRLLLFYSGWNWFKIVALVKYPFQKMLLHHASLIVS